LQQKLKIIQGRNNKQINVPVCPVSVGEHPWAVEDNKVVEELHTDQA